MNIKSTILPIIFSLLLIIGIFLGRILDSDESNSNSSLLVKKYHKLNSVLGYIESEYVDDISSNELIEKSLPFLLENLDPHSVYIPAKELLGINESLEGNFDGIGVQFNIQHDTIMVVNTVSGGPSEKLGILAGDRIVKIDDTLVAGINISNEQVLQKLKGLRGTKVKVSIYRPKYPELIDYTITRDVIPLYSVDVSYMITDSIGYVKISSFGGTTYQEFKKAILRLQKKGMKKIILDLRGNGGGYLDAATKITDEFLEDKKLIVYTEGKARPKTVTYATTRGYCHDTEMAILLDEWSASASEIVAGAIQDNDRGIIIGRRSFGKGLVQEQTMLPDGSALRLTIARYYTPSGRCIQKPYEHGHGSKYNEEILDRYVHGEFSQKDSIKLLDSLKYITSSGRVVYGGGGIMPDIFIPVDTLGWTPYLSAVSNKGLIYQFAFEYVDENRVFLNKFKDYKELEEFLNKAHLINQFIIFAENKGVAKKYNEIKTSEFIIKTQIKAYIARNLFDNDGFYPIMKEVDIPLKRAIEVLSSK
ncbi:MAG: peptidase S41 [Bacteroidetes bacterium GWA2_31_9]|nr:MAG: peptidase S41 [Bacteroidetes bacterium GWA2_31_9]